MNTNTNLPHEEQVQVFCPSLCHFSETLFPFGCVPKVDVDTARLIYPFYVYLSDPTKFWTVAEIDEIINRTIPAHFQCEGIASQSGLVNLWFSFKGCPMYWIWNVVGQDFAQYLSDVSLEFITWAESRFSFSVADADKAALIEANIGSIIQNICANEDYLQSQSVEVVNGVTRFVFNVRDLSFLGFLDNLCILLGDKTYQ